MGETPKAALSQQYLQAQNKSKTARLLKKMTITIRMHYFR